MRPIRQNSVKPIAVAAALVLGVGLAGCSGHQTTSAAPKASVPAPTTVLAPPVVAGQLAGRVFRVTRITERGADVAIDPGTAPKISFHHGPLHRRHGLQQPGRNVLSRRRPSLGPPDGRGEPSRLRISLFGARDPHHARAPYWGGARLAWGQTHHLQRRRNTGHDERPLTLVPRSRRPAPELPLGSPSSGIDADGQGSRNRAA